METVSEVATQLIITSSRDRGAQMARRLSKEGFEVLQLLWITERFLS